MIERVSGILLEPTDAQYLVDALDALLRERRPSAQLAAFIDRLRKTVAKLAVQAPETGVHARELGGQQTSAHTAAYDLVDTSEAAAILDITPNGVRDLVYRDRLPAHRAGGRLLLPAAAVVARAERRAARKAG